MNEIKIPCSNCGTELVERTVHARELPVTTDLAGRVRVAACPECDARYYPETALSRLSGASNDRRSPEDG